MKRLTVAIRGKTMAALGLLGCGMRNKLALLAVLGLLATSASAATFNYSYTFESGYEASGSFTGEKNGDFIEGISDITLFLNGVQASGDVFGFNLIDGSDPIVSFDALLNNFVFVNGDPFGGDPNAAFLMLNFDNDSLAAAGDPTTSDPASGFESVGADRWRVQEVPEAGTTAGLLLAGCAALAVLRRPSAKSTKA